MTRATELAAVPVAWLTKGIKPDLDPLPETYDEQHLSKVKISYPGGPVNHLWWAKAFPVYAPETVESLQNALLAAEARAEKAETERDEAVTRQLHAEAKAVLLAKDAEAAEAELLRVKGALDASYEALTAHNDILRGAFGAAQRDAIHEIKGTTNYNLLADASLKVLTKYHSITNVARAAAIRAARPANGGETA